MGLRLVSPRPGSDEDKAVFDDGVRRFRDRKFHAIAVKILPGEHYVTDNPDEMLVTVVGSCVAACIRDPVLGVGGMNHFMLAEPVEGEGENTVGRRHDAAMNPLIDAILARGGRRERLEVKLFGGGNLVGGNGLIGTRNADFVERYLIDEGLVIAAHDLRGDKPRRVHYFPATGRVYMLPLRRNDDQILFAREERYHRQLLEQNNPGATQAVQ